MRVSYKNKIKNRRNESNVQLLYIYFCIAPLMEIVKQHTEFHYFIFGFLFVGKMIWDNRFNLKFNITPYLISILLFFYAVLSYAKAYQFGYLYNWLGMLSILYIYCIPWFFYAYQVKDWSVFSENIGKYTPIMTANVVLLLLHDIAYGVNMYDNMHLSYAAMPVVIFSFFDYFKKKNNFQLCIAIALILMIVLVGSRGPLVCIIWFVISYVAIYRKKHWRLLGGLLLGCIIILFNFKNIMMILSRFLYKYQIQSRTLSKIIAGTLFTTTGRDKIQNVVIQTIKENALFGIGLGGERISIAKEIYNFDKNIGSCYPHNLFLEILVQFGIIFGSCFIIIFLKKIYCCATRQYTAQDTVILLVAIVLGHLMFSSSYLEMPMFFCLLGIIFANSGGRAHSAFNKSNP